MTLLEIEGLEVRGRKPDGTWVPTLRNFDLRLQRGEVVALVGESGAGKSTAALAAMGYARPGTRIASGRIAFAGIDLRALKRPALRRIHGRRIAYMAQSSQAALNPAIRVGEQVAEPFIIHGIAPPGGIGARVERLLEQLELPDPATLVQKYPHQLSGGQQQRIMAAMALTCEPELLILDEPTTALDVTTQIEVLKTIKKVLHTNNASAIYVSHDLAVVAQVADRIVVMKAGEIVEEAGTTKVIRTPREGYTRELVRAFSRAAPMAALAPAETRAPLLQVERLSCGYDRVPVLHDVDLSVQPGEFVAIVGESGSGKSTLARAIAGLHRPGGGTVELQGQALAPLARQRRMDQRRAIQIVMQSPDLSLNPAVPIGRALERPLDLYFSLKRRQRRERVVELLRSVGLPPDYARRYPSELSGGQRQRVSIARALAAEPKVVVCDEILSSLDSLVAAQILDLLRDLRRQHGMAYVFISHDISTVEAVADRVVVLYQGRVCEVGPPARVFGARQHPYTAMLQASVPTLDPGWLDRTAPPSAGLAGGSRTAAGCVFRARCALASELCLQPPPARQVATGHVIFCHKAVGELTSAA